MAKMSVHCIIIWNQTTALGKYKKAKTQNSIIYFGLRSWLNEFKILKCELQTRGKNNKIR